MNTELKNEFISVIISSFGAELKSIKKSDGNEVLHQPDEFWKGQAPVLFPVCGAPSGGKITVDGKDYPMNAHGIALTSEFKEIEKSNSSATFLLTSSEKTKKSYPYDFEFYVTYKVDKNSLEVKNKVVNKNDGNMYFSFGSHEGYICRGGINGCSIIFEKREKCMPIVYETGKVPVKNICEEDGCSVLELNDELFFNDITVIYENVESDYVVLRNKNEKIKIEFKGIPNLCVWTKPYSGYVCIEPWCGMPDFGKTHKDISEKKGILKLEKGESFERAHKIFFE